MGFFKSTNLDWIKALIKEGSCNANESQLLLRWATSPPDDNLNKKTLQVLREIMGRNQRYLVAGGGKMNKKSKESTRIATKLIEKITKK